MKERAGSLAKDSFVKSSRLNSLWFLALLMALLSYTLDFECVFSDLACQQVCVQQNSDDCGQPTVGTAPIVLLLPLVFTFCHRVEEQPEPVVSRTEKVPRTLAILVPIGLRAPPIFSIS